MEDSATHDTELNGEPVLAGGCNPGGTDRQPRFSPDSRGSHRAPRTTSYGLAFDPGIHRCPGAKLAGQEAAVVIHETAAALKEI
jgi:cytochrome P450